MQKLEFLNLEPKNTLFKCFAQQLWKTIVIFEISTLEFALLQSFVKKMKILKCGTKHVIFPYFVAGIWKYYCHIWHQCPWICLLAKFGAKIKIFKFGTKNAWFGYFWTGTWKLFCHIWNQDPRIFLIAKFREKMKMSKFGTNNALFKYFWARIWKWYCHIWNQNPRIYLIAKFLGKTKTPSKMRYLGIFGLGFYKTTVIFEIGSFEFVLLQNFVKKQKWLHLGLKCHFFGIFHQECLIWVFLSKNFKNYCQIWNQHPWICLIAKYCEIMKMPKNLGPKVPYLGIFGLEF